MAMESIRVLLILTIVVTVWYKVSSSSSQILIHVNRIFIDTRVNVMLYILTL